MGKRGSIMVSLSTTPQPDQQSSQPHNLTRVSLSGGGQEGGDGSPFLPLSHSLTIPLSLSPSLSLPLPLVRVHAK